MKLVDCYQGDCYQENLQCLQEPFTIVSIKIKYNVLQRYSELDYKLRYLASKYVQLWHLHNIDMLHSRASILTHLWHPVFAWTPNQWIWRGSEMSPGSS